jgi:hypothetical protein
MTLLISIFEVLRQPRLLDGKEVLCSCYVKRQLSGCEPMAHYFLGLVDESVDYLLAVRERANVGEDCLQIVLSVAKFSPGVAHLAAWPR